jgi:error-prone DNA polymerase
VAKAFPHISARHLREGLERLPELQGLQLPMRQLDLLFRVAERLDGFPRHIALHPCGIVLASHDLVQRVPLERSAGGHRMIQADKDDVEALGYLKLDILGVRMLSSMRHAIDEIARTTGQKVDLDRIALDDEQTFELIRASDTLGCFQIESPGQRELLQKLQPERFEDLIVDISLFRPGPVKSDMIRPYIARRGGLARPTYAHPALRPALQETFGVIVFHEQVIRTLAALAGYDLTYADHVRRHLDDAEMLPGLRGDFLERAIGRGVDPAAAEQTWDDVSQFASFGFCKAHAAAFAVPTYRSAWLKTHYRAQFLAGILTHDPGMYPRRLLLDDARRAGVPILPLDVHRSESDYVTEETADGALGIRIGLQDVHGISATDLRSIQIARSERPFADMGTSCGAPRCRVRSPRRCPRRGVRCVAGRASFAPVRGDHGRGATRGRPADPHRDHRATPRLPRVQRRRGGPRRARRLRHGRHPPPRQLLRAAPAGSRCDAGSRPVAQATGSG